MRNGRAIGRLARRFRVLLSFDVGNTNTVIGLSDAHGDQLLSSWRVSTRHDRMPDEWFGLLAPLLFAEGHAPQAITNVIMSTVVPSVTAWLSAMAGRRFGVNPVIVTPALDHGVVLRVDNPAEVGADRLANSVAAYHHYGGPAIVIDFGTATNFDVVAEDGAFIGGAIAPGLTVVLDALTSRAAKLFAVNLEIPPVAIGTNTTTNMQSGIVLGYLAMLEGMIQRIQRELTQPATVVATGGHAELFAHATPLIDHHDQDLTLTGLNLIFQRLRR